MRSHRRTVGARLRDQQHVALCGRRQAPVAAEYIAGLADRPDNVYKFTCGFFQARQIDDFVIGLVQRRTDQRVHARVDTDVTHVALALELGDPRKQDTSIGDQITAWLGPKLELRISSLDLGQRRAEHGKIQRCFIAS